MISINPFLLFDGNCVEAMTFYQSCFGGDLTLIKLGDTPMKDMLPPDQHHRITNARLISGAVEFSATDWLHPTRMSKQGNMLGILLKGQTYGEIRVIFDKLAEG